MPTQAQLEAAAYDIRRRISWCDGKGLPDQKELEDILRPHFSPAPADLPVIDCESPTPPSQGDEK